MQRDVLLPMRLLILLLSLFANSVWAATGSAAADTFYVRPAADCANNGDGMAYACAASAGASGAWRTSAAVSYSTTTGVDDGDTLKFCGSFVEADLDTGAFFIFLAFFTEPECKQYFQELIEAAPALSHLCVEQRQALHDEARTEGRRLFDRRHLSFIVGGGYRLGLGQDVTLCHLQTLHDELDQVGDIHTRDLIGAVQENLH